jgi:DUF4097 and DUF4098 domain-containing protein YvlB
MRAPGSPAKASRRLTSKLGFRILISFLSIGCLAATGPNPGPKVFEFQTGPAPSVTISNLRGQVTVRSWDKQSVRAACTVASPKVEVDAEPMPAEGPAERVQFSTHLLDSAAVGDEVAADYVVDVPAGTNLEVRNRQGRIQVAGLSGETWVETVGGSITVADASGHLDVHSLGGDVEIDRPAGHVEASTITGNLEFLDPTSTKIRGATTSGHILYQGDFMPGGEYTLSAYSGDMEIFCPASASVEIHAQSVKGRLDNGVDVIRSQHEAIPRGGIGLLGTHNQGKARLDLRSYSGTIRLRTLR